MKTRQSTPKRTIYTRKKASVKSPPVNGVKQDANKLGYIGSISQTVDRDAWFTPSIYIEAAREALSSIDLDPFSSEKANEIVKAERFFTIDDDAFKSVWGSDINVFMNPPYGRGICSKACLLFLSWWQTTKNSSAIVLTNNATDTKWFQAMLAVSSAVCFTNHRIAFYSADGKSVSGNTRGQTFFYFGEDVKGFGETFKKFGIILKNI